MGATTIWERWDSMRPDGSVKPSGMTSFNHYALGAIADWLHRSVAGLAPAEPGYRRLLVRPRPAFDLTDAETRHETPYGEAAVRWERAGGRLALRVLVPVGVTAEVHLPGTAEPVVVGHGEHRWEVADPTSDRDARELDPATATVRDLVDHPSTWARVVEIATEAGITPLGDVEAASKIAAYLDSPVAVVPGVLAPEDLMAAAVDVRERFARALGLPGPGQQR
jgi:alpha-L-rhamnosidase